MDLILVGIIVTAAVMFSVRGFVKIYKGKEECSGCSGCHRQHHWPDHLGRHH